MTARLSPSQLKPCWSPRNLFLENTTAVGFCPFLTNRGSPVPRAVAISAKHEVLVWEPVASRDDQRVGEGSGGAISTIITVMEIIRKLYMSLGLDKWLLRGPHLDESISNRRLRTSASDDRPNRPDARYTSWLEKYPSVLSSFHHITNAMQGKQIVVFLDYDGTLTPIVNDPSRAFMSDHMRSAVRQVAQCFPTAIISGRSRDKVYEFVQLDEVYYAGSHGMDIIGPPVLNCKSYNFKYQTNLDEKGKETTIFQPAKEYLPSIKKMLEELRRRTSSVPGALVEDNSFCISVHYRHVLDEDYEMLEEMIHEVLSEYSFFHLTRGKKVLETRPSIKWNKGDALVYLLDTLGFSGSTNVLPVYIGDDRTDEDAFKVLRSQGQGYPIIVTSVPRETSATHSLRDPSEVLAFLTRLVQSGEELA